MSRRLTLAVALAAWLAASGSVFANPKIEYLGKSAKEWAKLLQTGTATDRQNAAFALGKCNAGEYADLLLAALADGDEGVRVESAAALGELDSLEADRIITALQERLRKDESADVRRAAAFSLGRFKSQVAEVHPALKEALRHNDPRVRQAAAHALGQLGPEGVIPCMTELTAVLADKDLLLKREAIKALGHAGEKAAPAVRGLTAALDDADDVVRFHTANTLGAIGPAAEEAFKPLLKILRDPEVDPEIATAVMVALSKIGGDSLLTALPEMRAGLTAEDPHVRQVACVMYSELGPERLTRLGPQAPGEFMRLLAMLKDKDEQVRQVAAQAIHTLLPAVRTVVTDAWEPMLRALEKEPNNIVRRYLAWSLLTAPRAIRFVPRAKDILVKAGTSDADLTVRGETARIAVFFFGEEAEPVTETLIDYLNDKSVAILQGTKATAKPSQGEGTKIGTNTQTTGSGDGRVFAAEALRDLGEALKRAGKPRSEAAKKALLEASKDPTSAALREAATKALQYY
jgi:HEAT repeat protein